jgi:hypothetical protein
MHGILAAAIMALLSVALQPDDHDDAAPLQVGYAVVTPIPDSAGGLVVFETFGLKTGAATDATGVLPGTLTTDATMFVNVSSRLGRDLGLALTNPGNTVAQVDLTIRRDDGILAAATQSIFVSPRRQQSSYISQIFAGRLPADLTGTLTLHSSAPVGILALRARGASFTTEPITGTSAASPVPVLTTGVGGPNAVLLPHFATGASWATEIVVQNSSGSFLDVRVDLFKPDGSPLTAKLNGVSSETFRILRIPAGGVGVFAPRDTNGDSRF